MKVRLSIIVSAGLLLPAVAAHAGGTFPVSVPDVPAAWYADSIQTTVDTSAIPGVSMYPSASNEYGTHQTSAAPAVVRLDRTMTLVNTSTLGTRNVARPRIVDSHGSVISHASARLFPCSCGLA